MSLKGMNTDKRERRDPTKRKNSKKTNAAAIEGFSTPGYGKQKEESGTLQLMATDVDEKYSSENTATTSRLSSETSQQKKNVDFKSDVESLATAQESTFPERPEATAKHKDQSEQLEGEGMVTDIDEKSSSERNTATISALCNESLQENKADLKSDAEPLVTAQKSPLSEACTSNFNSDRKQSEHLKQVPLTGYIHNTSPVKSSVRNYTYFNFQFQTANNLIDGVCFDKSLYQQIKQKDECQKSVRISNYTLKRSLHDNDEMSLVVSKRSKIENVFKCAFDHNKPERAYTKINAIEDISDFSLIVVVGRVHVGSAEQCQVKVQGRSVMKLECILADETGSTKLVLWDKKIPLVKDGQIYHFFDVRVRSYQSEKYLSTNFDTIISEGKSDELQMKTVSPPKNEDATLEKTVAISRFLGVHEIQRFAVCNACRRKLSNLQSDFCVCDSCGLSQIKTSADQEHFSVALLIKEGDDDTVVRVMQEQVKSFLKLHNETAESYNQIKVVGATDREITQAFLSARNLKITFNKKRKIVSAIISNKEAE